ncbi:A-kinase anchor protein 9 [Chanos chanos]|uniref:A-kinase anchor protein 9 n=1 Tax=Chanos chanos TaxID=29144 RepID=A0A6J2WM10_CHACN|nr:A-kinase anchor protein 9 [Chanos chanos]
MEDEERQKKLEAGKAKLAEYRQRKANADGQKKPKKKKKKGAEDSPKDEPGKDEIKQEQSVGDEVRGGKKEATTTEFSFARTLRSGETVKHDQTYTIEPESEVSTTAEDYSSEVNGCREMTEKAMESSMDLIREEDLRHSESHSEHELRGGPPSRLQIMEDELAAKNQIVEELSRELEEIRAAFGTEGVQQLQDFEAALKQRDGIITQLTANLQQAREEKDEVMREFLELTEQSQKLKIQFQQLQAGETLRNTSHSSTAADLLQARQQIVLFQQQLEERDAQVQGHQRQSEEQLLQINHLQQMLNESEMVRRKEAESFVERLQEKDVLIAEQERLMSEHQVSLTELKEKLLASEQQLLALNEQLSLKTQELESCQGELSVSRQKERMSSAEIMQLMGTVEDLQKRYHQGSQSEGQVVQRMEEEMAHKMEQLRAELDEMYGQQIVQMKQELRAQHSAEVNQMMEQHSDDMNKIKEQHQSELDRLRQQYMHSSGEINALNVKVIDLQQKLQETQVLREKAKQELTQVAEEKLSLQSQVEHLQVAKERVEVRYESIDHQSEAQQLNDAIKDLQAQLAMAENANNELEAKHESEITNYKIKLEMLEREKDAVLDRMAESQEAELERLRTQLLFSHEEELSRLREDLQRESLLNVENIRNEMALRHRESLEELRKSYEERLQSVEEQKAVLATERVSLLQEIVALKNDLNQALENSKAKELVQQLKELQLEIEELKQAESDRVTRESEFKDVLQKNELLLKETKEKEESWEIKRKELEYDNNILKESNLSMRDEIKHLNEEREATQQKMDSLSTENKQMHKQLMDLKEEIDKQKNTFSFAEKNFEVNYQELKDEYTCLVNVKIQLEERLRKETLEYEARLCSLQAQLQQLQQPAEERPSEFLQVNQEDKMEDDTVDCKMLAEKHTTELMEKLETTEREKADLRSKLSEATEKLTMMENGVKELEGELRLMREESKGVMARNKELERELEAQTQLLIQHKRQTAQSPGSIAGSCSTEDHYLQIKSLEEEVKALQYTLQGAERERDLALEQHNTLEQENRTLLAQLHRLREVPVEETSVPPLIQPVQSDQQQKVKQQGCSELEQRKKDQSAAEQSESVWMLHTQRSSVTDDSNERHDRERQKIDIEKQVKKSQGSYGDHREPGPVTQQEDMEGMEHVCLPSLQEECRLHMEAQRISLSQIHAAQLELQRESLHAQAEAQLRRLEQELRQAHAQELQRLEEEHQRELEDVKVVKGDPRSTRYQRLTETVSEECNQIIQSFRTLLGEEVVQSLQHKDPVRSHGRDVQDQETRDVSSQLQEAKDLCRSLQQLKEAIEMAHGHLLELQNSLRADGNKMEELQMAYDELRRSSEEEIASLRMQIDGSQTAIQDTSDLRVPLIQGEEVERLRAEFQQQQAQLEERHKQEIEHLRAYYQQQAKEMEERYTTEIILLHQKLQEFTGTEGLFSIPSVTQLSVQKEDETEFKLEEDVDVEVEPRSPVKPVGLGEQLQTLRKALYHKYLQEVAALKEQHRTELERVRGEQQSQASGSLRGGKLSTEELATQDYLSQILERQHQERVEEEIAKVIVQMSVEFARKTELARISKQAKETTSAMQTQAEDSSAGLYENAGDVLSPRVLSKGEHVELKRRYEEERERLERELRERTEELLLLKEELHQTQSPSGDTSPGAAQGTLGSGKVASAEEWKSGFGGDSKQREAGMKRPSEGDETERRERDGREKRRPGMQNRSTQTEKRRGEEELEEVKKASEQVVTSRSSSQGRDPSPDIITTERNLLRKANESLRQVLSDVLKTTAAAEETIGRYVEGILEASSRGQNPQHRLTWQRGSVETFKPYSSLTARPGADTAHESCHGSETMADDVSVWSGETETDEGLEMSQQLTEGSLTGAELQLENEEYLMNISVRLQAAVEKLLVAITETTNQLEHARVTQTELMRESFRHNAEMDELLRKQEELQERLAEEARAREQLALELHKAEGLIDGYTGERAALEKQVRQKEELQLHLEQELHLTSTRLQELELERQQMQQEKELLSRQQDAMRDGAGSRELHLLEETEKLMKEKVEVQRQAEKENSELLKQMKVLEAELEDQVSKVIELENAHRVESADLRQQIQALEKQLEKNRKFLDEQAIDREHERDVFQQEIQKLEQQLKNSQKQQPSNEQRNIEVDQLTNQLQEKTDWCSELLLRSEQLQRDVEERDEEIEKLGARVRELEQALLASSESLHRVEENKQHASMTETLDATLEAQLQTEREALDRKEKEICNLEEQLEQFREELENKSEEVQQLHMQLEIQRKELSTQQQDLAAKDNLLRVLEEKDREIAILNEQIAKLQHTEATPDNKVIEEKNELLRELESKVEYMSSEQERLKRNSEEEIDQLSAVIEKLQQELSNIEHKQPEEYLPAQDDSTPSKEEYDEMKQKMDEVTKELDTLKADHSSLLSRYETLQEEASEAFARRQNEKSVAELEEALREKTAAFVVVQAQVQALEQSASSRVADLTRRVEELELCIEEKDSELNSCRVRVEKAQADAEALQHKISELEEKLREKVAALLVSQAQLGAVQAQSRELHSEVTKDAVEPDVVLEVVRTRGEVRESKAVPVGKVGLLTEKLKELEEGLSGMQKDQELQKQLLSSSEEEVVEYERRLAVLMDLLNQMRAKPVQHRQLLSAESKGGSESSVSELLQELQEVRDEAAATKEELSSYRERSDKLQEELQVRDLSIAQLQKELQQVKADMAKSVEEPKPSKSKKKGGKQGGKQQEEPQALADKSEESVAVSELRQELQQVRDEATATKEELSSYRERSHKLQEELQIKDTTIAKLQEDLQKALTGTSEKDSATVSELLQEVRAEAAATKEELSSYKERSDKLQEELKEREMTIALLKDQLHRATEGSETSDLHQELQEVRHVVATTKEELNNYREHNHKLKEELQIKETTIAKLQEDLQKTFSGTHEKESTAVSELLQELEEVREEAAATKTELCNYREQSHKLQEDLQEREMAIALLKDQLHKAMEGTEVSSSEFLQELQEVRAEAVVTKEELSHYKERNDKLQEELKVRDLSIAQLREELQQVRTATAKSGEEQQTSQTKKKSGKHGDSKQEPHGKSKGVSKDKPSLSRKNSAVQSEKSSSSSAASGTSGVQRIDVGTQVDVSPGRENTSEEIAEVISEYREKIEQMQELHAAEIMDMETRHISESENLKREAQELEEECKALKAVIEKLRSTEALSTKSEHLAASQFKDGYASDSSSDWSQRTGQDLPNVHQEFRTTPEGARRENEPDVLPDRIKTLLREVHQEGMQVLSLSELSLTEGDHPSTAQLHPQGWTKERDALLDTVQSLKALITKIQTNRETQVGGDWRAELLGAVKQVFVRERDVLKSALYSHLELLDTSDAVIHLNQLERRLAEQDSQHREALAMLHTADRNSLLTEVRQLRAQLEHLQLDTSHTEITSQQQHHQLASPGMAERGAGEQGDRDRGTGTAQGHGVSHSERLVLEELKSELAQTKLELETTLKAQHKQLKDLDALRTEVSDKAAEVDALNDKLAEEQRRSRELQWAFEKEKCKSDKKEESEREELEDLRLALEEQQNRVAQLSASLQQECDNSAQLKAQLEQERSQHRSLASELQVQLESQLARSQELSSALDRERELNAQFRQKQASFSPTLQQGPSAAAGIQEAEAGCSQVEEGVHSMEVLLQNLQKQLDEKHTQVVKLVDEVERQKLEAVQAKREWEEERSTLERSAAKDQNALREAQARSEHLENRVQDLQGQLAREREKVERLERERDALRARVTELTQKLGDTTESQQAKTQSQGQTGWRSEGQTGDRTRDWVLQQKAGEAVTLSSGTPSLHEALGTGHITQLDSKHMDNIVSRLQLIANKIKGMTGSASSRLSTEGPDRESLAWLQSNVEDVVAMLQQAPSIPSIPEGAALVAGGSSSNLTERLLRQNAELTGFVSRLTEEKNDLRNQLLKLEEEVRRYRQRGQGSDSWSRKSSNSQEIVQFSSEREAWNRERSRLEKALRHAEAELTHLRSELRTDTLRDLTGPDADNAALKRIYGKYLRSESFRKALIYQKKYLLLLLGGFQECEEATLSLIARMGGRPSHASLESLSKRRRGFTRFRSAVRVSIALSRMRFLVRRWQRAAGVGSVTSPSVNRNGIGQITGSEGRNDSPYLHPGTVEVYGERRGTSRGRTGRDSPRSGHSGQHRFHGIAGEHGALTCSHLQNYDPDRALTDYISRLEALQRRLGSVQSGSSSYAQLHFGMRR